MLQVLNTGESQEIFCNKHISRLIEILFQHQQQVVTAVERAKQVTMSELNSIIGVRLHF